MHILAHSNVDFSNRNQPDAHSHDLAGTVLGFRHIHEPTACGDYSKPSLVRVSGPLNRRFFSSFGQVRHQPPRFKGGGHVRGRELNGRQDRANSNSEFWGNNTGLVDQFVVFPCFSSMARLSRIAVPGSPHHVPQRGVRLMDVFHSQGIGSSISARCGKKSRDTV